MRSVSAFGAEYKNCSGKGVLGQCRLHHRSQFIMSFTEVHRPRCDQYPNALRWHQHEEASSARAISTIRVAGVCSGSSMAISPKINLIASFGTVRASAGSSGAAESINGAKSGSSASCAGSKSFPCLARRRHAQGSAKRICSAHCETHSPS